MRDALSRGEPDLLVRERGRDACEVFRGVGEEAMRTGDRGPGTGDRGLARALLALAFVACAAPRAASPCGPRMKCGTPPPPETEEQQWAHVKEDAAQNARRASVICGASFVVVYDEPSWQGVATRYDAHTLLVRASGANVDFAMKELAETCRVGAPADRAAVVAFKRVVISYRAGNAPASIEGDVLHLFVDPESNATDLYALRRQFGWKWQ